MRTKRSELCHQHPAGCGCGPVIFACRPPAVRRGRAVLLGASCPGGAAGPVLVGRAAAARCSPQVALPGMGRQVLLPYLLSCLCQRKPPVVRLLIARIVA